MNTNENICTHILTNTLPHTTYAQTHLYTKTHKQTSTQTNLHTNKRPHKQTNPPPHTCRSCTCASKSFLRDHWWFSCCHDDSTSPSTSFTSPPTPLSFIPAPLSSNSLWASYLFTISVCVALWRVCMCRNTSKHRAE